MTALRVYAPEFAELRVADVMTIDPVVVGADDPIDAAEDLLATYRISGLPVVGSDGRLAGVISNTDLVPDGNVGIQALLRANGRHLRVGELMTSPAVTVSMMSTLVEAARLMHESRIHRLVAVDDAGRPVGVLSASDYVTVVAEG
ncbi:MAG TPA: CBS domain-containing protein [Candidatus Limnocylindrales bacterium]|nr:CBS domain-containing protein [Candidatus Limnocylindrales bacterium]